MHRARLNIETPGRRFVEITDQVTAEVRSSAVETGLCHLFIQHTSASLAITENADPDVLGDLETFLSALAPDGDPHFMHTAEGPDDMPAHVRNLLTQTSLTVPVEGGRLALGTWQGVFLLEHRQRPHRRVVVVTVY